MPLGGLSPRLDRVKYLQNMITKTDEASSCYLNFNIHLLFTNEMSLNMQRSLEHVYLAYKVSQKNCSTFDKILKTKDNMNRLMQR